MSYALLDATRVAKAAKMSLVALDQVDAPSEAHLRRKTLVERIQALAEAAACTQGPNGNLVTLTSEEFWLISQNW